MNNFYNPYMIQGNYMTELQNMRDRIDNQINQMNQQQQNMAIPQPTNLTQNFQLANNPITNFKLVNDIDDVNKEIVIADTYFLTNDFNNLYIKNSKGDIRTFNLKEIIPKDDKDILIENLQKQIEELKGGKSNGYDEQDGKLLYEQSDTELDYKFGKQLETEQPANVSIVPNSKTTKRRP